MMICGGTFDLTGSVCRILLLLPVSRFYSRIGDKAIFPVQNLLFESGIYVMACDGCNVAVMLLVSWPEPHVT